MAELTSTHKVALYVTGVDEPAAGEVNDRSAYPSDWSAARWIAYLARSNGIDVWGENSGQDDAGKMMLSAQRIRENSFLGLMWGFESELYADPNADGFATIDNYAATIAFYSYLRTVYLPTISRSSAAQVAHR